MGTGQLYLTDERTDLEFLDKAQAERGREWRAFCNTRRRGGEPV